MNLRFIVAVFAAFFVFSGASRAGDPDFQVRMKNRSFSPIPSKDISAALRSLSGRHGLVQLFQTPGAKTRRALSERGLRLLRPLSGRTWLAYIEDRDFGGREFSSTLRWAGVLEARDKIASRVREGRFSDYSRYAGDRRVLDVGMHEDVSEAQGRRIFKEIGAPVLDYSELGNSFLAAITPEAVPGLAARDETVWIDEAGPALAPTMNVARPAVGGDVANEAPYSLRGNQVKVFVLDGGTASVFGRVHSDLAGRVTVAGLPVPDIIGHPSHVSCTIAGNGEASGGLYQGMAPEALIISSSIIPSLRLPPMYNAPGNIGNAYKRAIQEHGATVANNSIGSNLAQFGDSQCDKEGDYERTAQLIDKIVAEAYGRITIVWANGNERGYGSCGVSYYTTAPPATAKNVIAVGAVNKEDFSMTSFSSYGPTDDGRMRPDISAPGCARDETAITSCAGPIQQSMGTDYLAYCGTSMAAPVVTGSVALAQEYWRRKKGGEDPRASTMKALFIHGAQNMEEPGPDYKFGYGVLNLPDTLDLIDSAIILEESLDQDESFQLELISAGGPAKVTMVWTDPPAELLAERTLVNDLDLRVETAGGVELPWSLYPDHPSLDAVKEENHIDPVEQVLFEGEAGETVEIHVRAGEVPMGPQVFSLVISGLYQDLPPEGQTDDDPEDEAGEEDEASSSDDDDDDGCGC